MSELLSQLTGRRVLFVASTGGHLAQLVQISGWTRSGDGSMWVTFDKPQSRALLSECEVQYVPYIKPRGYAGLLRSVLPIARLLRRRKFDLVISTGAAVALAALPLARLFGTEVVYVESVSRFAGPSLTGRVMGRLPFVRTYTQHESWSSERWRHEFSVMNSWSSQLVPVEESRPVREIFVTLGTIAPYRFDALVDRLLRIVPAGVHVTWQLGSTDRDDLHGDVFIEMPSDQFDEAVRRSDVVITHAGVGTLLQLLEANACVVTVPRRANNNEHVDNHQYQVARDFSRRGLARIAEADILSWEDIENASRIQLKYG